MCTAWFKNVHEYESFEHHLCILESKKYFFSYKNDQNTKLVLKYPSGTIITFQDFFHQHEFGCWWRTHHHLRQTPWSRRHQFFIQSFFTLNTSLGQITLEDYLKLWEISINFTIVQSMGFHWRFHVDLSCHLYNKYCIDSMYSLVALP